MLRPLHPHTTLHQTHSTSQFILHHNLVLGYKIIGLDEWMNPTFTTNQNSSAFSHLILIIGLLFTILMHVTFQTILWNIQILVEIPITKIIRKTNKTNDTGS